MRRKKLDLFTVVNHTFFVVLCIVMAYPFWHTLVGSLMTYGDYMSTGVLLYPAEPTLAAYQEVFSKGTIFRPLFNTIVITAVGTVLSLLATSWTAYGLSKRMRGVKLMMTLLVISMFLETGLIPSYIMFRGLGLLNSYGVYIIPQLVVVFFMIIFRSWFRDFQQSILDSARIDGLSEYGIFFRIVMPLSKPVLAAIGLFLAVKYWNTLFPSLFFITDADKKLLQEYLYRIIRDMELQDAQLTADYIPTEIAKLANVMLTVVPILLVYPFLQKYFVKGIMLGAIKG
jgi:putative aldouronate transport system permease protein